MGMLEHGIRIRTVRKGVAQLYIVIQGLLKGLQERERAGRTPWSGPFLMESWKVWEE